MTPTGISAVSIVSDGFVAHRATDEDIPIRSGVADDWQRLRAAMPGQNRLTVRVPRTAALQVLLAGSPRNRRELARMMAGKVPVRAGELAMSEPRDLGDGTVEVIVVKQAWLDRHVQEIERELAVIPRVIVEPDGARLLYRSPAARRRTAVTSLIVGVSLVAGVTALAIAWSSERAEPAVLEQTAEAQLPGISSTVLGLALAVPPQAALAEIARDGRGGISVEIDSLDPEELRFALATGASARWRETSQTRQGANGYRTRFVQRPGGATEPTRAAEAIAAPNRREASVVAVRSLQAKARARVVALELHQAAGGGSEPLDFAVRIAGPQAAVLSLADDVESDLPGARFAEWRLQPEGEGIRLTGTLIVPWRPSR